MNDMLTLVLSREEVKMILRLLRSSNPPQDEQGAVVNVIEYLRAQVRS